MTNLTNSTLNAPVLPWAVQGTFILDQYIGKTLGGVGILVNLLFVVLFSHKKTKTQDLQFLMVQAIYQPYCMFAISSFKWILLSLPVSL